LKISWRLSRCWSNEDVAEPDDGSYEHGKDRCPKTMLVGRRNGQLLF
jgi:hypothetical protein